MGKYPEKYGKEHREVKKQRIEEVGEQCEVTGRVPTPEKKIHSHHLQKISLGFLSNSHMKENIRLLLEDIHEDFHQRTDSDIEEGQLIYKRQNYAKRVWNEPENEFHRKDLDRADSLLIPEYIDKMLALPYQFQAYIRHALIGAYETNKALMIENRAKDLKIEKIEKELEKQKTRHKAKIIQILDYQGRMEE